MRDTDKKELRQTLVTLLCSYQENPSDDALKRQAQILFSDVRGQLAYLDSDMAKAVSLLETIGYSQAPVDTQKLTDVLAELNDSTR